MAGFLLLFEFYLVSLDSGLWTCEPLLHREMPPDPQQDQ